MLTFLMVNRVENINYKKILLLLAIFCLQFELQSICFLSALKKERQFCSKKHALLEKEYNGLRKETEQYKKTIVKILQVKRNLNNSNMVRINFGLLKKLRDSGLIVFNIDRIKENKFNVSAEGTFEQFFTLFTACCKNSSLLLTNFLIQKTNQQENLLMLLTMEPICVGY